MITYVRRFFSLYSYQLSTFDSVWTFAANCGVIVVLCCSTCLPNRLWLLPFIHLLLLYFCSLLFPFLFTPLPTSSSSFSSTSWLWWGGKEKVLHFSFSLFAAKIWYTSIIFKVLSIIPIEIVSFLFLVNFLLCNFHLIFCSLYSIFTSFFSIFVSLIKALLFTIIPFNLFFSFLFFHRFRASPSLCFFTISYYSCFSTTHFVYSNQLHG